MNFELKFACLKGFGSQTEAAKRLRIDEARLSRLINEHREPTADERRRFAAVLGVDYFAADGNPVRGEGEHCPR
jgi:transcriptional regulator with XRE-family HTH domain